jgi:hypothetical protein
MFYADQVKNAQLAIECFEWVLERSTEKEDLLEASKGKSQGLFWMLPFDETKPLSVEKQSLLQTWTKSVATTYQDDAIAVSHYALSLQWHPQATMEQPMWFQLAWSLLRRKCQSPPPGFHFNYFESLSALSTSKLREGTGLEALQGFLLALEQFELFMKTVDWKEIDITRRFVVASFTLVDVTNHTGSQDVPYLPFDWY